jgi:tight adherence protein C
MAVGFLTAGPSSIWITWFQAGTTAFVSPLPDALDLMVVSVEAGLGLDQAIQYVARELITTHPDVSEEFQLVNLEIRAGKRRVEALRNLAERTGETELRKLVAILVQTERFGTSIADSLRTHSDSCGCAPAGGRRKANKVGVNYRFSSATSINAFPPVWIAAGL